jgi:hypothetical protein
MRAITGIMMIPHTPPQNASEITLGTQKGFTGVIDHGANGAIPALCSSQSTGW